MSDEFYLSGKVFKRSLPVIEGPPSRDAPRLKRLVLAQGELAQVHDGEPGIRYLAVLELREQGIRGNHFHRIKDEFLYIIQGQILLVVEDISTRQRASFGLQTGDLAFIPTTVAHAFRSVAVGQGIEFSSAQFAAGDIYPYPLI